MSMAAQKIDGTKLEIGQFVDFVRVDKPIDLTPREDCDYVALLTEPNREFTVAANLTLRKLPFYVPTFSKPALLPKRAHLAGKVHPEVVRPLFPGIVLIPADIGDEQLVRVFAAYGVMQVHPPLMRFGDRIAVLRPSDMALIRGIELTERERYLSRRGRGEVRFKIGDAVRAAVGELLGGHGGTVEDIDDHGRITVLMDIFKRKVRVHLTQDQVEAV